MTFASTRRHQWWSVDVRYFEEHGLPTDKPDFVIGVLGDYSQSLVASLLTPRQNLTACLIVLRGSMLPHGVPEGIVSDGGGIFRAKDAQRIYVALGIDKRQIDSAQAWQNYIETVFNVQRRMADYHFAQATTWAELEAVHSATDIIAICIGCHVSVWREVVIVDAVRPPIGRYGGARTGIAMETGAFDAEIVPVTIPQWRGDPVVVTRDEHPRPETTIEALRKLRAAFR